MAMGGICLQVELFFQHIGDLRYPIVERLPGKIHACAGGLVIYGKARRGGIGMQKMGE